MRNAKSPSSGKSERSWCNFNEMCERLQTTSLCLGVGIIEESTTQAHVRRLYRLAEGFTWESAIVAHALVTDKWHKSALWNGR